MREEILYKIRQKLAGQEKLTNYAHESCPINLEVS